MCIIAYMPSNVEIPEKTIEIMFKNNPDGAGLMWKPQNGDKIQIRKGFMTLESLLEAFRKVPKECERAIHCRIATSGKIGVATCHPFPVRSKLKAMRKGEDATSMALMHNGIISYCTPKEGMAAKHSDTMEFAQNILFPLRNQLDNPAVRTLLRESTSSRLLIFRSEGKTLLTGKWEVENGIYFSNTTFKSIKQTYCPTKVYPYSYGYGYGSIFDDAYDASVASGYGYNEYGLNTYELCSYTDIVAPNGLTDEEKAKITRAKEDKVWDALEMDGCEVIDITAEIDNMECFIYAQFRSFEDKYSPITIGGTRVTYCGILSN